MRGGSLGVFVTLALFATAARCSAPSGTIPIKFGKHVLYSEVAQTEPEREHGLMFRDDLPEDRGMIFVFDQPDFQSFWMKNTPLPLSIAFVDDSKTILNLDEMAPRDEKTFHRSKGAAKYAIEANQGWFSSRGIKAGDKVEFELP